MQGKVHAGLGIMGAEHVDVTRHSIVDAKSILFSQLHPY